MAPSYVLSFLLAVRLAQFRRPCSWRSGFASLAAWFLLHTLLAQIYFAAVGRSRAIASRLEQKVVLVTGAGGGLGRLVALRLVACGRLRKLIAWDLDKAGLEQTKAMVTQLKLGSIVETTTIDVSNRAAVSAEAAELVAKGDAPDVLILNAGIARSNAFLEDKHEEDIRMVFNVNVFQLFWLCQAFLPAMSSKTHFNRIVTVASIAGMAGNARMVDYSSSKFAAVGFAESLRMELRKRRSSTSLSTVNPYVMDTGMFKGFDLMLPMLDPKKVAQTLIDKCILGDRALLCLPEFFHLVPLLKMLPVWFQVWVNEQMGALNCMDTFVGRGHVEKQTSG